MKSIDARNRNSQSLLGRRVTHGGRPRLYAFGPYVESAVFGVKRNLSDCVRQRGGWVSARISDGEYDQPTGDRRDDR